MHSDVLKSKKMSLKKKISIIGRVYIRGYNNALVIRDLFIQDKIELVSSKWANGYRQKNLDIYPLNLKSLELWSTYRDRVHFDLYIGTDNKLWVDVTLEDGNNWDGSYKRIRWTATFKGIPTRSLKEFKKTIECRFNAHIQNTFYHEEEVRMKNRMKEIERELLLQ